MKEELKSGIKELDSMIEKFENKEITFVELLSYLWNKGYDTGRADCESERQTSKMNDLLAEKITKEIMTFFDGENEIECIRIQLMLEQSDGSEKNIGGRDKESIKNVIIRNLNG